MVSSTGVVFSVGFQWWHVLEETVLAIPRDLVGVASSDKHLILLVIGNRTGVPETTLSTMTTRLGSQTQT